MCSGPSSTSAAPQTGRGSGHRLTTCHSPSLALFVNTQRTSLLNQGWGRLKHKLDAKPTFPRSLVQRRRPHPCVVPPCTGPGERRSLGKGMRDGPGVWRVVWTPQARLARRLHSDEPPPEPDPPVTLGAGHHSVLGAPPPRKHRGLWAGKSLVPAWETHPHAMGVVSP